MEQYDTDAKDSSNWWISVVSAVFAGVVVATVTLIRQRRQAKNEPPPPKLPDELVRPGDFGVPPHDLLACLEVIRIHLNTLARKGVLSNLQPGLEPSQVREMLSAYGVEASAELETLYSWRNGTAKDPALGAADLAMIPGVVFPPLEQMIDTYLELNQSAHWNPDWFPVFAVTDGDFLVVSLAEPAKGSVRRVGPEYSHWPTTDFTSLTAMIQTFATAFAQGAFGLGPEGQFLCDNDNFHAVAAFLNPEIPGWAPPPAPTDNQPTRSPEQ